MIDTKYILFCFVLLLCTCTVWPDISSLNPEGTVSHIYPDYKDVTVPRDIAPLNFICTDSTYTRYIGRMECGGTVIDITSDSRNVCHIPLKKWQKITHSESTQIIVTLAAQNRSGWHRFEPFRIKLSEDSIDSFICYRKIAPGYGVWGHMGIYQRRLCDFKEMPVLENSRTRGSCMNCHSFCRCSPSTYQFHLRGRVSGTVMARGGTYEVIDMKNDKSLTCTYPYWHPEGRFIAYSVNDIVQAFHNIPGKMVDVYDLASDIVIYDTQNHTIIIDSTMMRSDRFETFPAFSPDGNTIYFCSAPSGKMNTIGDLYNVQYALFSAGFDPLTGRLTSNPDTLLSIPDATISFPRPSHDGRYLLFTHSAYGNFTIWHQDSDLWTLNMTDRNYRPAEALNSPETESYHSWSSNSKWVVFSSRRGDGLYTRPFIAHVNNDGTYSKPFLLPQENPDSYTMSLYSYNIPEFVESYVHFPVNNLDNIMNNKKNVGIISHNPSRPVIMDTDN